MKAENIQSIKNVPEKPQPQLLRQGDFVVSEVIKVDDGTALLRTAQGMLLSARLLGELGLMAGDRVETVVDEAGQGRYVLRLLDISHGETAAPEAGQSGASSAQSLKSQTLYSALNMLKKNAGLEPKTAEFMARNGIAATPENIGALTRLAGGGPRVAQDLTQMMADAAPVTLGMERAAAGAGNQPVSAGTAETLVTGQSGYAAPSAEAGPSGAVPQNAAMQASAPAITAGTPDAPSAVLMLPPDMAAPAAPSAAAQTDRPGWLPPDAAGQIPATEAAPKNGTPVSRPDAAPQNGPPISRADTAAPTLRADATPQNDAQAFRLEDGAAQRGTETIELGNAATTAPHPGEAVHGAQEPVALLKRLMALFANVKDREALPTQLKQAAHELPAQLKELKNSLRNADDIDRNTLGQRAELLDRQFSMMTDIKRFDCYHVPLTSANGNPSTAELYVYRQRRRKTEEQPDSYAVLVGLDTQHMGRVETMIRAQGRSVTLEFRLEQASWAGTFEEDAKQLAPLIAQAGYRLGDVSVRGLEARTTVLTAEEALTEGQAADNGGLDIRI